MKKILVTLIVISLGVGTFFRITGGIFIIESTVDNPYTTIIFYKNNRKNSFLISDRVSEKFHRSEAFMFSNYVKSNIVKEYVYEREIFRITND